MPPPAATAPARPGRRAATCPPGATRVRRRGSFGRLDDVLVDGAEDALAVLALHLDADGVAKAHELGLGRAVLDGLYAALLRNAAVALGPLHAPVLALAAFHALVAHGAAAHDGAGAHIARLADMGDELAEVKAHVLARIAHADRKSTRLNSSHLVISYAVFCLKKKNTYTTTCALSPS